MVRTSTCDGLIQIQVPAGEYQLTVTLAPLPEELAGQWISGLALLAIVLRLATCNRHVQRRIHRDRLLRLVFINKL